MIAADDIADGGLVVVDQPGAAMAADIVEGADLHVVAADQKMEASPMSTVMQSPGSGTSGSTPT